MPLSLLPSRCRSLLSATAPLVLLLGCGSPPAEATQSAGAAISGPSGESCDRTRFNCKVPNFESTPSSVSHDTNRAFDSFDESYYWPLLGQPALYDGVGNLRGYVSGSSGGSGKTKLDFGERKTMGGVTYVYAFSADLTDGQSASGWIPQSSIYRQNTLAKMPTIAPPDPGTATYETDWVVTGGDLASDHASLALNLEYGDRRVDPNATSGEHASDYLVRQWDPSTGTGYVNLLYNLPGSGGVSDDTLPMCVHFKRYTGVDQLETDLYFTGSPYKSKLQLHFVYGSIGGRRGWISHEVLTASTDLGKLDPAHPCYVP